MDTTRTIRSRAALAAVLVAAVVLGPSSTAESRATDADAAAGPSTAAGSATAVHARAPRPNVIIITTDDMRADDLLPLRRTRRLLGHLQLDDFVSNHPMCCPARAELLTGQLGQHNGVHANSGRWGGYGNLLGKDNTLPQWFRRSGYSTALVGKFVNGWCPWQNGRPIGWTDFTPLVRHAYSPYHYFYVGDARTRPAPEGLHTNDFVTQRTLRRIREYSAQPRPFLIWSSYVAPHDMEVGGKFGPPVPAARHRGALAGAVPASESSPSYEEPHPRELARASAEDAVTCRGRAAGVGRMVTLDKLNQRRLESLLSVDEGVGRMVRTLQRVGELQQTIIVFTSDNGYHLGEHGIVGKNSYYEESLRVPLFARGPGVAAARSSKGAMITDIAPSLARLASVKPRRRVDGRRDLFATDGGWGRVLIQAGDAAAPWLWRGVRTKRWSYVERRGARPVLYDRQADPRQMQSVAGRERDVVRRLRSDLASMTR